MIENIKDCTGCGACKNICPLNAISIEYNEYGFYAPIVNNTLCVRCGKCKKICPAIEFNNNNIDKPICYVAYADDEERKNSTSGAIFPILAKYVFSKNGYVCGVAWNKNWEAEHIIIENERDLHKIRFSKYVQANTKSCFSEIKQLLDNNKMVLFSGTPCQNAGLISYLGKSYDNLITIDILCHGAPSPKVWQDYLEQNFEKDKITNINFRKKEAGWLRCGESWYTSSSSSSIDFFDKKQIPIGIYYEAFIKHQLSNEACLECKYRSIPRPADFTLGDFWNLYNTKLNDKKGLSAVLINNAKAKNIFNEIVDNLKFHKKVNLHGRYEKLEICNNSRTNKTRERFFKKYKKGYNINKIINESINKHYDVGLATQFNFMNYGSALVAYAANNIIESLGYTVLMINKDLNGHDHYNPQNRSLEFARKYYNLSKFYAKDDDLRELNDLCDSFIVGSDTMWWDTEYGNDFSWLDFVSSNKRKIAFCTSFAHKEPKFNNNKRAKRKYLYKRFNALSSREASGVDILKNIFDVEAIHLYDPTLIADKQIFDDLANKSRRDEKKFVFAYMLDLTPEKEKVAKYIADKLNLKLKLISNQRYKGGSSLIDENNISIEDFVYFCKNAEFIISDSFHGTCFSTIFKKTFISLLNTWRGLERYQIFIDNNLHRNLFDNIDDIYKLEDLKILNPDFRNFENKIKIEKEKATKWLKDALDKPLPKLTKEDLLYDYFYNELHYNNLTTLHKKNIFIKNLFSAKNEYSNNVKRKVITILGIKVKIKL